jgi:UDP-glucose 4-epimerase
LIWAVQGYSQRIMRIAITGASGNVGTALLRRLRADGEHEVTAISRRKPPATDPYGSAEWKMIDLSSVTAKDRLTEAFNGMDAVVHLAWMIQPSHDRGLMRSTNQGGTQAVADAASAAGVPHLVHMSSVGTYAAAPGQWKDESWSTKGVPTSSYSVDKAACEVFLDQFESLESMTVTRVRPGLILQPDAASEISRYFIGRLDRGFSVPLMKTDRAADELGWQPAHSSAELLPAFVDALARGAGGTGPLLYPRSA